ncbi:unnamed protein product, partial [Laminaria digitata]
MKELEEKYLRVTNETIRALQAKLAATTMEPNEDPDHYIMQATRLRSRLAAVKEPVTDRHFTDIIVQGLPESYRDIKLTTYKDPHFDLPKIQSTMRHLYLDGLSRGKTRKSLDVAPSCSSNSIIIRYHRSVVICHNCGKESHYKSGCAVPGKWCSVHKTTTHGDTEC